MTDIIGAAGGGAASFVKDATIETFQADVLQASLNVPVIVDFWATWCGPCKTLGPILESQVNARGGKVLMVKVDIDKNQMLAQQLRIQSVPTVMVFIGGQPVDGFAGARPESEISAFVDRAIDMAAQAGLGGNSGMPDASGLIEAGDAALAAGDLPSAMAAFSQAVEIAPAGEDDHVAALAGMARCALTTGNKDQAEQMLSMVPPAKADHPAVAQVRAALSLQSDTATAPTSAPDTMPTDAEGFFRLGQAQIDAGDMENAIPALLSSIELDKEWEEGTAREKLLTIFEALGSTHPAVKTGRRRLSSILFA